MKKLDFSTSISETSENVCFDFMTVSFGVCIHIKYFFDVMRNKTPNSKCLLKLIKRRSKVQKKNMSCERVHTKSGNEQ